MKEEGTLTHELVAWHQGDSQALNRAWSMVYDELKAAAKFHLGSASNARSISATGLIHETYLKFRKKPPLDFQSRAQFFCFASKVIRHMIVDHFRRKKVRANLDQTPSDDMEVWTESLPQPLETSLLLAIDDALAELETANPRRAKITLLRFYAGFTLKEVAEILEISVPTVKREWQMARMWFAHRLDDQGMSVFAT